MTVFQPVDLPCLSRREAEVCAAVASGERTSDIAKRLNLDKRTVGTFKLRAKQKLGVVGGGDVALANAAIAHGIIKQAAP